MDIDVLFKNAKERHGIKIGETMSLKDVKSLVNYAIFVAYNEGYKDGVQGNAVEIPEPVSSWDWVGRLPMRESPTIEEE